MGEKGKSQKRIAGIDNYFIVKDGIELGAMIVLPLWVFGFLY